MKIEVLYFFTSQDLLHMKTSLSAAYTYEKKKIATQKMPSNQKLPYIKTGIFSSSYSFHSIKIERKNKK